MNEGWLYIEKILTLEEILILLNLTKDEIKTKTINLFQNKESNAKLSLSKIYGDNAYPFHTDGVQYPIPPKFIILQNHKNHIYKTKTLLIDSFKIANTNRKLFYNSIFTIKGNNNYTERTSIINSTKFANDTIVRFNPIIMRSNFSLRNELVEECFNSYNDFVEICWKPNSTLIINNWRILHSRTKNLDLNNKRELSRIEIYTI